CLQQVLRVLDRRNHLVACVAEQPLEPRLQQYGVFGNYDAHGTSTVMRVGPPFGDSMSMVPPAARTRSRMPARPPCPRPSPMCAPPTPLSRMRAIRRQSSASAASCTTVTVHSDAAECLATLVSASATAK